MLKPTARRGWPRVLAASTLVNAEVSVSVIALAAVLLMVGLGVPNLIGWLGLGCGGVALAAIVLGRPAGRRSERFAGALKNHRSSDSSSETPRRPSR